MPHGELKDFSEKQREVRKTEFDVRDAIETLGHEVFSIGVSDDLSTIRGAIDALKPDIAFNLLEEFAGISHFDQHVVSYLDIAQAALYWLQPARADARARQGSDRENSRIPRPEEFRSSALPQRTRHHAPSRPCVSFILKSLTKEGSVGISSASIVHDDAKLKERVEFIHRTTNSTALAEQFVEGREIYVGVIGNDRVIALPAWEFAMTKREDGAPSASHRAKWDPRYQRQVGLMTGPAKLSKRMEAKFAGLSKQIYRLLGMSGYARLDYRLTEDGEAYLSRPTPIHKLPRTRTSPSPPSTWA